MYIYLYGHAVVSVCMLFYTYSYDLDEVFVHGLLKVKLMHTYHYASLHAAASVVHLIAKGK